MGYQRPKKITVLLVDDHPLLRQALRAVLEKEPDMEVVGEASDGAEAVALAEKLRPDVAIMDVSLPGMDGAEATRRIKVVSPDTAVLALTVHDDDETIAEVLLAGALGYLTKGVFGVEVVQAVRIVATGDMVLSRPVGRSLLRHVPRYRPPRLALKSGEALTQRELEVLRLVACGMPNSDIAAALGLSVRTVKGYLTGIFAKLGVNSRTEAVAVCLQQGIISTDDIR
jgi:DNA-binding NarL/FixJ family response regulator